MTIYLKTEEHLSYIRRAGHIAASVLSSLPFYIKPGVTTKYIDGVIEQTIKDLGGTAPCKGYVHSSFPPFPSVSCISVNSQAVHCVPSDLVVKDGDVVKVDLVVGFNGWCADTARTYLIPPVRQDIQQLAEVTYIAMLKGIEQAVEGKVVKDISQAVFEARKDHGVVAQFCGHGIGKAIHEDPKISNIPNGDNTLLCAGMVCCIEPIFTLGKPDVLIQEGSWDTWTLDGSIVAHNEHTILIKPDGLPPEILTLRDDEKYSLLKPTLKL